MIAYLKGKAVTQVTEILREGRMFTEHEIKDALDKFGADNPVKKKGKKGKK